MTKEGIKAFVDELLAAHTEMAAEDTLDWQIREAIEYFILALDETAVVYPFDVLNLKPAEWANLFKASEVRHGWVIKRATLTDKEHRANSTRPTYFYDVWGFYGFYSNSRTDNSDKQFQRFLDLLSFVTRHARKLGLECGIDQHELLQFPEIVTIGAGRDQLHFAEGRLEVRICC